MIELKHLSKIYDAGTPAAVTALEDISLTIRDGEIFGIIGLSGAGKSTLVRCINLLETPTSGQVVLDVGIHVGADGNLCGDTRFAEVEPVVEAITPVPGGVGPMTRAQLMKNILSAAKGRTLKNG